MLRRGRTSLGVGVLFLAACFGLSELAQNLVSGVLGEFIEVGLQIVGWVAMWRPIEIYLYDWWPLRGEYQLLERLARMRVSVEVVPRLAGEPKIL